MKLSKHTSILSLFLLFTAGVAAVVGRSDRYFLAATEFVFQFLLIYLLIAQIRTKLKIRNNPELKPTIIFFISITFAFFADCLYSIRILYSLEGGGIYHTLSECLYGGFALFLATSLFQGIFGLPKPRQSWDWTATISFLFVSTISYQVILVEYYQLPLPFILKINATLYALTTSLMFSILLSLSFRIQERSKYWFIQTLLLYLISDFSIRYQSSFITVLNYSWSEYGYCFTFVGLYWCFSKSIANKFDNSDVSKSIQVQECIPENNQLASPFSIRSLLTLAICGSNMVFIVCIILLNGSTRPTGDQISIVLFLMYACWFTANEISWRFTRKLESLISGMFHPVETVSDGELVGIRLSTVKNPTQIFEISKIIESYNGLALRTNSMITLFEKTNRDASLAKLASQVSHDIRSPLSALNFITSDISQLPENSRMMIKEATNRINDIANDLLHSKRQQDSGFEDLPKSKFMVSHLIESVVSEKRILTRDKPDLYIRSKLLSPYGMFIEANPTKLYRVLSNLLQNSIEALPSFKGEIQLHSEKIREKIQITLIDNGSGMTPEVLNHLGQEGFTHGKLGSVSGSGMGFCHALKTVEEMGGQLVVTSTPKIGTQIKIVLPSTTSPAWFTEAIEIYANSLIVIIDDDESIHQTWATRFRSISESQLSVQHFRSPQEFLDWQSVSAHQLEEIIFLVDFEFTNNMRPALRGLDGLELIQQKLISKNSILVTSHYDEAAVTARCEELGVKVLPKDMAGFVPIVFKDRVQRAAVPEMQGETDAILIDDDELVRMTWNLGAELHNKNIECFESYDSFLAESYRFSFETPIYVDFELGLAENGLKCANNISLKGYKKVFIATGHQKSVIGKHPFVSDVVGKEFPWPISTGLA